MPKAIHREPGRGNLSLDCDVDIKAKITETTMPASDMRALLFWGFGKRLLEQLVDCGK